MVVTVLEVAPGDAMAGDDPAKIQAALAGFRFEIAEDPSAFDEGYRLLDAEFGAVNELERREVLEPWFRLGTRSPPDAPVRARYHLLLARTPTGEVAAVRDCFTALDPATGRVVVLMSHSLVRPAWRRSGLAGVLRASPVAFARAHARDEGVASPEILLVLEMEHIRPTESATMVRVLSYLRAGMKVVPPWEVPYAQPDFRDLDLLGEPARPIPFMLLVRQVGREHEPTISWERMIAVLDGLGAIHRPSVGAAQVDLIRAWALRYHDGSAGEIPLLAPDTRRPAELFPLLAAAARGHYPPEWLPEPPGSVEHDRAALEAALGAVR